MQIPSDYKELLRLLNRHKAKYLIVGAYAVTFYAEPRYTKDLDIWVEPDIINSGRVYAALKEFGAPLKQITIETFADPKLVYQIGVEPVRVDIIMGISGVSFETAWKNRRRIPFNGIPVNMIGIHELITSKLRTKRLRDKLDIESLKESLKIRKGARRGEKA